MGLILEKTPNCAESSEVQITITKATQFTFNGDGIASIYLNDIFVGSISSTKPVLLVHVAGEYKVIIVGPCNYASVSADDVVEGVLSIDLQPVIDAINNKQDFEYVNSGWICNAGVTDTWIRTVTPYIDGVAQTPIIIDSGISCDEEPPEQFDVEKIDFCREVTADGVGYAVGDTIRQVKFIDTTQSPPVEVAQLFFNETQGTTLPDASVLADSEECKNDQQESKEKTFCVYFEIEGVPQEPVTVHREFDSEGEVVRDYVYNNGVIEDWLLPEGAGNVLLDETCCKCEILKSCVQREIASGWLYRLTKEITEPQFNRINTETGDSEQLEDPPFHPAGVTLATSPDRKFLYAYANENEPFRLWRCDVWNNHLWTDTGIDIVPPAGETGTLFIHGIYINPFTGIMYISYNQGDTTRKFGTVDYLTTGQIVEIGTVDNWYFDLAMDETGQFWAVRRGTGEIWKVNPGGTDELFFVTPTPTSQMSTLFNGVLAVHGQTVGSPVPTPESGLVYLIDSETTEIIKVLEGIEYRGGSDISFLQTGTEVLPQKLFCRYVETSEGDKVIGYVDAEDIAVDINSLAILVDCEDECCGTGGTEGSSFEIQEKENTIIYERVTTAGVIPAGALSYSVMSADGVTDYSVGGVTIPGFAPTNEPPHTGYRTSVDIPYDPLGGEILVRVTR